MGSKRLLKIEQGKQALGWRAADQVRAVLFSRSGTHAGYELPVRIGLGVQAAGLQAEGMTVQGGGSERSGVSVRTSSGRSTTYASGGIRPRAGT